MVADEVAWRHTTGIFLIDGPTVSTSTGAVHSLLGSCQAGHLPPRSALDIEVGRRDRKTFGLESERWGVPSCCKECRWPARMIERQIKTVMTAPQRMLALTGPKCIFLSNGLVPRGGNDAPRTALDGARN